MTALIETMRAVAHPWLCDGMGHLTTRNYTAVFDDASYHLFAACGYLPEAGKRLGWADVSVTADYLAEVRAMELLIVRSAVVKLGSKSVTSTHEMSSLNTGKPCARVTAVTVQFDTEARQAVPLDSRFRDAAAALFALER